MTHYTNLLIHTGRSLVALVAIAAGYFYSGNDTGDKAQSVETPTVCGSGSVPGQNCISPPPQPPGRTVYFTPAAEGSTVAFALVVTTRSFRVIQVASAEDIPNYSQGRIIETGGVHTQRQLGSCRPCIIKGDVKIDVGPIAQEDDMAAHIRARDSEVKTVDVLYKPSSPRGPPLEDSAVVYVIGDVKEFSGPDQFDQSRFLAGVDLGTSYTEMGERRNDDDVLREEKAFENERERWEKETAEKFALPAEQLGRVTGREDLQGLVKERSPGPTEHPVGEAFPGGKAPSGEHSAPRRGAHR